MGMADQTKHTGGMVFHVTECYIWAAIFYLDSPTDYRECLAQDSSQLRSAACADGIIADFVNRRPVPKTYRWLVPGWTLPRLLLLIAAMFLYLTWYL
jgi:hypothetical protein